MDEDETGDLFSSPSDVQFVRLLLADLNDDLPGKISRYRYLTDMSATLGRGGTMIFGGLTAYTALVEARSSFVHGNFAATIMLCQALVENTLAAHLHVLSAIPHQRAESLPPRVKFSETLKRCQAMGFLTEEQVADFGRLTDLRNPLSHFRSVDEPGNLMRRSLDAREAEDDLLSKDAHFAIATIMRLLANEPFALDNR